MRPCSVFSVVSCPPAVSQRCRPLEAMQPRCYAPANANTESSLPCAEPVTTPAGSWLDPERCDPPPRCGWQGGYASAVSGHRARTRRRLPCEGCEQFSGIPANPDPVPDCTEHDAGDRYYPGTVRTWGQAQAKSWSKPINQTPGPLPVRNGTLGRGGSPRRLRAWREPTRRSLHLHPVRPGAYPTGPRLAHPHASHRAGSAHYLGDVIFDGDPGSILRSAPAMTALTVETRIVQISGDGLDAGGPYRDINLTERSGSRRDPMTHALQWTGGVRTQQNGDAKPARAAFSRCDPGTHRKHHGQALPHLATSPLPRDAVPRPRDRPGRHEIQQRTKVKPPEKRPKTPRDEQFFAASTITRRDVSSDGRFLRGVLRRRRQGRGVLLDITLTTRQIRRRDDPMAVCAHSAEG